MLTARHSQDKAIRVGRSLCVAVVLVAMSAACQPAVRITQVRLLAPGAQVAPGEQVGIMVNVDNPGHLPLTYRWQSNRGEVRVTEPADPSALYTAPTQSGVDTISVIVLSDGQEVAQDALQVEVRADSVSQPRTAGPTTVRATLAVGALTPAGPATVVSPIGERPPCPTESSRQTLPADILPGSVHIDEPQACTTLAAVNTTRGTYSPDVDPNDIWVLVYPHDARAYWPQYNGFDNGRPARKLPENKWDSLASLGAPERWYDVVAVVADKAASEWFTNYLTESAKKVSWPPIAPNQLPPGIAEKDSVTVFRDK